MWSHFLHYVKIMSKWTISPFFFNPRDLRHNYCITIMMMKTIHLAIVTMTMITIIIWLILVYTTHVYSAFCTGLLTGLWVIIKTSTIHLWAAEETKSRVKSLISDHFSVYWQNQTIFRFLSRLSKYSPVFTSISVNNC